MKNEAYTITFVVECAEPGPIKIPNIDIDENFVVFTEKTDVTCTFELLKF